jgi:hypothetical protein
VWKHIRRGWGDFSRFVKYEVGDELSLGSGMIYGVGDQPLKESFPKFFSIARCKEAWIADNMQFSNVDIQWIVSFIGSVQDLEVDLMIAFFVLLYSLRLRKGVEDRIC